MTSPRAAIRSARNAKSRLQRNTLKRVAEDYLKREGVKLRTGAERGRIFESLIYPRFGNRPIDSVKRSDIVRLKHGPHRAQAVLAILSKLFNWHASWRDDFLSPIRRGMARVKPQDYARDRVLSDDEIRAVWRTTEAFPGPSELSLLLTDRYTALGSRRDDTRQTRRR